MNRPRMTGRTWAYIGATLGGAVSIAANVAHSYVPPPAAPVGWSPPSGAVAGAVFWPVALFVAVEIFARIAWPHGRRWTVLRFGGLLPVAMVAAVVSYRHLSGLLAFYREDALTATIGPLAVDGLMVMATGALIATGARRTVASVTEPTRAHTSPEPAVVASVQAAPAPAGEPASAPAARPARRRAAPKVLTAADRVVAAHNRHPDAPHKRIADLAGVSVATVKRHRPRTGSPSGPSPASTAPNGRAGDPVRDVSLPAAA